MCRIMATVIIKHPDDHHLCTRVETQSFTHIHLICSGALDEDVVVIEATPAPAPIVPASEEINVTSTDSEVEIVTVGDSFR